MPRQHFADTSDLLVAIAMFRGFYKRVAAKAGVHPTMVSRVARGERTSPKVSDAIGAELRTIRDYLNRPKHQSNGK
jgi:hypothetical protein